MRGRIRRDESDEYIVDVRELFGDSVGGLS
jgi:hypothetical protein